jgi:hypothetical protein
MGDFNIRYCEEWSGLSRSAALDKEHGAILGAFRPDETTSALAVIVKYHENPALTAGISWHDVGVINRKPTLNWLWSLEAQPGSRTWLAPVWQDHARPPVHAGGLTNYFDLKTRRALRLTELTRPAPAQRFVVIDEIQRARSSRCPCAGRSRRYRRVFDPWQRVTRPASPVFETLAGRLETVPLEGFRLADLGAAAQIRQWLRGGFPLSFTARIEADSVAWRRQFLQTFLERDLPQLGVTIPAVALRRFWHMLAHYHGQIWNAAELARALAVNESTVRRYLDLMTGVFMVRQLPPWFENLGKRQVKAPKVYLRDSGSLHTCSASPISETSNITPRWGRSKGYA